MVQNLYEADGRRLDGPGMPDLWGAYEKGKQNRALTKRMESGAESDAIRVKSDALDLKGKPRKMAQEEQMMDASLEMIGWEAMQKHTKYALGEMAHVQTFNDYVRLLNNAKTNRGLPSEIVENKGPYVPAETGRKDRSKYGAAKRSGGDSLNRSKTFPKVAKAMAEQWTK